MDIPHNNSIQERQSFIAQATARGLQLSEDGRSWVPISPKTNYIPLNGNNVKVVNRGSQLNTGVAIILALIILLVLVGLVVFFAFYASIWILSELGDWFNRFLYG